MKILKVKVLGDYESIEVEFKKGNQTGKFRYLLFGENSGIIDVENYEEKNNEDIFSEIHEWVNKHITTDKIIKLDGKEIKWIKSKKNLKINIQVFMNT